MALVARVGRVVTGPGMWPAIDTLLRTPGAKQVGVAHLSADAAGLPSTPTAGGLLSATIAAEPGALEAPTPPPFGRCINAALTYAPTRSCARRSAVCLVPFLDKRASACSHRGWN